MQPIPLLLSIASILVSMVGLTGCASGGGASRGSFESADFHLVLLRTGPNPEAATEELFQGHFAFMEGLAKEGKLLIAGPFGPDKHEEDLRGIFLIDRADTAEARALAAGDPPTRAGVFRQEIVPLVTLDVIRALPAMETRRQEERIAAGEDSDQPDIKAYTILTAPEGAEAAGKILSHPALAEVVVLLGRLGEPRSGELFAMLDVPTADEARRRVAIANGEGLEVFVDEWYGSPAIAELALGGGPPEDLGR